ncbi:MAG: hypothetical protein AB1696_05975 [Planctomycetota bacterium]
MDFRNIQLEMSLKPFKDNSDETMRRVCREVFVQWAALCRHADRVSVLLWSADGSEILEYKGDLDEEFEWAKWVGVANPRRERPKGVNATAIHHTPRLYIEKPIAWTYRRLKKLVETLKEIGADVTGKPIRVGATFDPGPEFAVSPFKYKRHPEICMGTTMGAGTFVCCYATLHEDKTAYAGFPDGIPEGAPMGAFLGRQCRHFLGDLGFDYLWLSNGFGFGLETWGLRGAVFDGQKFMPEKARDVHDKNMNFWTALRKEMPDVPIENRGTNLSTGMDLASDAVPLREIYRGSYGIEPPPNSPWAAINSDFGLELIGWMSHIAELPGETFPFRFYTHDPWFLNSPWLDRYGRQPHDIYLPLSVSRINERGEVRTPTSILFLTIDDSHGDMPETVPNEVIPHIIEGRATQPDQPGPLVWVYPFDEYHDMTFGEPSRIDEVFFGDWFMRGAVNNGLPLNTVVSARNLVSTLGSKPDRFDESLLVSPVPDTDSEWSAALMSHVKRGGSALLYGPIRHARKDLLDALNVAKADPLSGEFDLQVEIGGDRLLSQPYGKRLAHHDLLSAGGMDGMVKNERDAHTRILALATRDGDSRVAALIRRPPEWNGGGLAWVRGTVSCDPKQTGGHLLVPLNPAEYFPGEMLMRYALSAFGMEMFAEKHAPAQGAPLVCISRHRNGFYFAGFCPDTTVSLHLRFPQGAPLLKGVETRIVNGRAGYHMPKAWKHECRVFVEQKEDSVVSCKERHCGEVNVRRRLLMNGLKNATVRFYPEPGTEADVKMLRNPKPPFLEGDFVTFAREGRCLVAENISGEFLISW